MSNEIKKTHLHDLLQRVVEEEFPGRDDLLPEIMARARSLQASQPATPARPTLWAGSRGRQPARRTWRPLITTTVSLAVLAGLLAYAVFVAGLGGDPPKVTAAEIVARVERAAGDPNAFGLHTFHGVYQQTTAPDRGDPQSNYRQEAWFQEPDQLRAETSALDAGPTDQKRILICEGERLWEFAPGSERGIIYENVTFSQIFNPGSIEGFIEQWKELSLGTEPGASVSVRGEETILGRPAYVLEAITSAALGERTTLWVDKDYYLVLRQEISEVKTGAVIWQGGLTSLEINGAIAPALFELPADVIFEPAGSTPPRSSLAQVENAPFALFEPQDLPGVGPEQEVSMTPEKHFDRQPPELIADYFLIGETTTSETEGSGEVFAELKHLFRMTITPAADDAVCSPAEQALGGVEIDLGEQRGCSYTDPDGSKGRTVALTRDGSRIVLSSDDWSLLSLEELAQVAASLQGVRG